MIAGIAVMIIPKTMKSAKVVASKSGGGRNCNFVVTVGRPATSIVNPSSIGQSGSTISGDTEHIIVVQTDPGYAPNAGHAGTGTVVFTAC